MPKFSKTSLERLNTCHHLLQTLMKRVVERTDITVLCGHRSQEEQNVAFAKGASRLMWPLSHHNAYPSTAVDIAPWPIAWHDISRFKDVAEVVIEEWCEMEVAGMSEGYLLEWGGSWKNFKDFPHFQIVKR
jgi:peptidoglycan L-alanyl-D-glutamate endopeptidase CwlK